MTTDHDESRLSAALRDLTTTGQLDLHALERTARRRGTRIRRTRQGGIAVAALAVVGAASATAVAASGGGRAPDTLGFAGAPSTTPSASTSGAATPSPVVSDEPTGAPSASAPPSTAPTTSSDTDPGADPTTTPPGAGGDHGGPAGAYAVLDAPGWTAPPGQPVEDEKLYYVNGDANLSLNWRPDYGDSKEYGSGPVVATTTIGGDPAKVYRDGDSVTVVGDVRDGRFLTLASSTQTVEQMVELATQVFRN